jgi:hypothetical protein
LLVVGDHGFAPIHSVIAPNSVLGKAGLLTPVPGLESTVTRWSAIARSNGGSAFVYAQKEQDAVLARTALVREAAKLGGFRVVAADELLRDGADPDAWFGLEGEPGFDFDDTTQFPVLAPAELRGAGGYLPTRGEMDAGFVAWGRGCARGCGFRACGGPTSRHRCEAARVELGGSAARALVRSARASARLDAALRLASEAASWPQTRSRSAQPARHRLYDRFRARVASIERAPSRACAISRCCFPISRCC